MKTQLEKLKQKKKEIVEQIKELREEELLKNSKTLLKEQQIIGTAFLKKYNKNMEELKDIIYPWIKKIKDIKLFDLKTKNKD